MWKDSNGHLIEEYWLLITDFTLEIPCVCKIGFSKSSEQSSQSQKQKPVYCELRANNSNNILNLEDTL